MKVRSLSALLLAGLAWVGLQLFIRGYLEAHNSLQTNLEAEPSRTEKNSLRIKMAGHTYVNPDRAIALLESAGSEGPIDHFVLLGDYGKEVYNFVESSSSRFSFKVHFVPGNHDSKVSSPSYYKLIDGDAILIFLSSMDCHADYHPHEGCWFSNEQLAFLDRAVANIPGQIQNVFLFVHHIFWFRDLPVSNKLDLARLVPAPLPKIFDLNSKFLVAKYLSSKLVFAGKVLVFG
ncbi:MAG: hypothetical protein KDD53_08590, partial [Bdellovibrionales bacterium]|nr:hypothetical protein [Bdellovibrionales bacterium]